MGVLWVRWFGHDLDAPGGFQTRHLHRVGFVDFEDPNAFGFLDPNVVIRVVHLIPAFACGRTSDLLLPSLARKANEDDEDWRYYYVNMFVIVTCSCDFLAMVLDTKGPASWLVMKLHTI